jgi:hypothetical protein
VPRFFLHSQTNVQTTDIVGFECSSAAQARTEAVRICGQMMRDAPEAFWQSQPWTMDIVDETGLLLWEFRFDGLPTPARRLFDARRSVK